MYTPLHTSRGLPRGNIGPGIVNKQQICHRPNNPTYHGPIGYTAPLTGLQAYRQLFYPSAIQYHAQIFPQNIAPTNPEPMSPTTPVNMQQNVSNQMCIFISYLTKSLKRRKAVNEHQKERQKARKEKHLQKLANEDQQERRKARNKKKKEKKKHDRKRGRTHSQDPVVRLQRALARQRPTKEPEDAEGDDGRTSQIPKRSDDIASTMTHVQQPVPGARGLVVGHCRY